MRPGSATEPLGPGRIVADARGPERLPLDRTPDRPAAPDRPVAPDPASSDVVAASITPTGVVAPTLRAADVAPADHGRDGGNRGHDGGDHGRNAATSGTPARQPDLSGPPSGARPVDPARRGPGPDGVSGLEQASCTAPQLRRFIKSRPYVPMHELRRRFGINGSEDDVSSIDLGDRHRVYVGLPPREGSLLGELLRGGDIGYELSLDPRTPIVIGLYPMRPVARN